MSRIFSVGGGGTAGSNSIRLSPVSYNISYVTGGGDETMALHKQKRLAGLLQEAGALL